MADNSVSINSPIGVVKSDLLSEMAAFDSLPRAVRRMIAYAPYKFSSQDSGEQLGKFIWEGQGDVIDFVKRYTKAIEQAIPMMARSAYGPRHPQAR